LSQPISGTVLVGEGDAGATFRVFQDPVYVVSAFSPFEVLPAIRAVEDRVAQGLHAAGFIAYEAASGLDSILATNHRAGRPLLWFGLFEGSRVVSLREAGQARISHQLPTAAGDAQHPAVFSRLGVLDVLSSTPPRPSGRQPHWAQHLATLATKPGEISGLEVGTVRSTTGDTTLDWLPSMTGSEYGDAIRRIKCHLQDGDTYQVNMTFKMTARRSNGIGEIFSRIVRNQRADYSALIVTDEFGVCSASPELFFELKDEQLVSKPMKGTSRRGLTFEEDNNRANSLRLSEKNRAENLMIVDMIRNDMGRIAVPGSVTVPALFEVERYPTVLQMTSTVQCRTRASFSEIVTAMFPCASVTGAPKVRTMEIIRDLECGPRGVYTGSIGYLLPGRLARFNVAIRTVWIDRRSDVLEYGIGSGVVWDSNPSDEYLECLLKADMLTTNRPDFDLLETMLWEENAGYFLLDRHLQRLERSAAYFGFSVQIDQLSTRLHDRSRSMPGPVCRVRVTASREGEVSIKCNPTDPRGEPVTRRVKLAREPVNSSDVFLYHKTTHRAVYERAIRSRNTDDVLLYNERGEITESTMANIVIKRGDRRVTPPVESGLLAGTFRQKLLDDGEVEEGVISVDEIDTTGRFFLVNSVRKWMPCKLVSDPELD